MTHRKPVKRDYIKAAKELFYPASVIRKLEEAKTEYECDKIMSNARKGVF